MKHTVKAVQIDPRWILVVLAAENKADTIVIQPGRKFTFRIVWKYYRN